MREVNDDARKEPGLGDSQEKPYDVELHRGFYKRRGGGDEPPGDQNAGKPFARTPVLDQQSARNLENQIADKKYADAESKYFLGKLEVARHAQLGETDIRPVEIGDEVDHNHQWHDAPRHLAAQRNGINGGGISHLDRSLRKRSNQSAMAVMSSGDFQNSPQPCPLPGRTISSICPAPAVRARCTKLSAC